MTRVAVVGAAGRMGKTLIQAVAVSRPVRRKDLAAIEDIRRWRCNAFGNQLVALMKSLR